MHSVNGNCETQGTRRAAAWLCAAVLAFEDQSWGFLIWGIVSVLIGLLVWSQPSILPYLVAAYAIMIGAFSIITAFLI